MSAIGPENSVNKPSTYPHGLFLKTAIYDGAIGAVVSAILTRPIYRKDRLQTSENVFSCDRFKPLREIAVGGFYKLGLQGLLLNYLVSATKTDEEKSKTTAFWKQLGCSLLAGIGSAPVINFYEQAALIKGENWQRSGLDSICSYSQFPRFNDSQRRSKDIHAYLFKERRMMRGLVATATRDAIFVCAYGALAPFFSQMLIKRIDTQDTGKSLACMAIGASAAGAIGGMLQTPADVLRAQKHYSHFKAASYSEIAKSISRQTWTSTILLKASIGARAVPMIFLLESALQD